MYPRPTLEELIARVKGDFVARLTGVGVFLLFTVERALAFVIAGVSHLLHGHIAWVGRQIIPTTADDDRLLLHADIWGLALTPPSVGAATLRFTGDDGVAVPIGTRAQNGAGAAYATDAAGVIAGGELVVNATAEAAGVDYSLEIGEILLLVGAIPGVSGDVIVVDVLTVAADGEKPASLLQRLEDKVQSPGPGIGPTGYLAAALEPLGFTRAWQYNLFNGAGTILVFGAMDDADTGGDPENPIPPPVKVLEQEAAIELVKYPTANITVQAPVALTVDMTLTITPDNPAMRAAVEAQVVAYLFDIQPSARKPLLIVLDGTQDNPGLKNAIGDTPGLIAFSLSSPIAPIPIEDDEIVIIGTTSYV